MVKVLLQGRRALFHSMLGLVALVFIQFVTEVQTLCFAHTNQSSPLLKCWRAVKWVPWPFTWTAWEVLTPSSTGPDHLGSAHFRLRNFTYYDITSELRWLLRASALHLKLVCTKFWVSLSQSVCCMFGGFLPQAVPNPKFTWYITCYCQLSLKAMVFSFNQVLWSRMKPRNINQLPI